MEILLEGIYNTLEGEKDIMLLLVSNGTAERKKGILSTKVRTRQEFDVWINGKHKLKITIQMSTLRNKKAIEKCLIEHYNIKRIKRLDIV
jgi:hypothetical protein